jgi:hypothetical protein
MDPALLELLRMGTTGRGDEVEAIIRLGDSTSSLARGLATLRSEEFESGVRFDSNADSNGSGYSGSALNPAGQKPQLEGTVPDGRGPSGTTGRREWDSNPRWAGPTHAFQACRFGRSRIPPWVGARGSTRYRVPRP